MVPGKQPLRQSFKARQAKLRNEIASSGVNHKRRTINGRNIKGQKNLNCRR